MDYLPSGLANRLETTQSLPEDYVLRVGVDVARALGFAHREGVIHRDIKVDNILFDTHGNAVVADFGIARALSGYTNQTGTNMVVGTPQYFAPEQARAKPLDGRADLYSLGVTLFRAATGRLPFEGEDWYEIARQHVEEPPPAPRAVNPALSPEFEAIVLQCMAKAADDRPATGELLADTIQGLLQSRKDPSSANTVTFVTTPTSSGARIPSKQVAEPVSHRRLWSGAAVATLLVAAIAAVLAYPSLGGLIGMSSAATDSLPVDSTGLLGIDPLGVTDPPVPVGSLPPNKGTTPGRGTSPVSTVRSQFGSVSVSAQSEVEITIGDVNVGTGNSRRDSLLPGQYVVRAVFPIPADMEGCPTNSITRFVKVTAGAVTPVTVNPQPCGAIEIGARGRADGTARTIWDAMQPEGQPKPADAPLTPGAKVFPVG